MSEHDCPLPQHEPNAELTASGAWQPSPFLSFSLLLHAGAVASTLLIPESWPWAAGAVAADQGVITLAGLWPRSRLLGPNWTRLPLASATRGEVSITIDDGPDPEVTPWVLDFLDRHGAKASFFCIGEQARRYPALCRDIAARGHDVENHSLRHRFDFAFSGYRGFLQELSAAQTVLTELSGSRPLFFRAPFGIRNPLLEPALSRLGLRLASWTRRGFDTRERDPDKVAQRLLQGLGAGDILLLHDGNIASAADGQAVILRVLPRVLAALDEANLRSVSLRSALS
jgi:peptidoglycan/xylan/chitin deacetylase (PgdA/CDA1 family)